MDALLYVEVSVDGATFRFGAADRAIARLMHDVNQLVEERAAERVAELGRGLTEEEREALAVIEEEDLPGSVYESLCEVFVEGLRGWRGVRDLSRPDGQGGYLPLEYTPEHVREFPPDLKVRVVTAYQERRLQLEQKKGSAGKPATS